MARHLQCVEYHTRFLFCDHRLVSVRACHYHERVKKENSEPRMCKPIRIKMTVDYFCDSCKYKNFFFFDEFDNFEPSWFEEGTIVTRTGTILKRSKSPGSSKSSKSSPEPSTGSEESQHAEHGWNPQNDTKETRRKIGLLELQNLEAQLGELLEHPIPESPINRQKAGPRKRPERLPTEMPDRRATARAVALVYAKPELVTITKRRHSEAPIRPSTPFPRHVYEAYRRPSSIALLPPPSPSLPAITLTPAADTTLIESRQRLGSRPPRSRTPPRFRVVLG